MAPELHKDPQAEASEKTDVFSLGLVLWAMLPDSDLAAWQKLSPLQVARAIVVEGGPTIPDSCDTPLKELIKDCWTDDPNQRPSSFEIMERLEELTEKPPKDPSMSENNSQTDITTRVLED